MFDVRRSVEVQPENKFSVLIFQVRLNGLKILAKKFISWCVIFRLNWEWLSGAKIRNMNELEGRNRRG